MGLEVDQTAKKKPCSPRPADRYPNYCCATQRAKDQNCVEKFELMSFGKKFVHQAIFHMTEYTLI